MEYKPDWEQAQQRLIAWWHHDAVDRCCVAVHARKNDSKLGKWLDGLDPTPANTGTPRWWTDPGLQYVAWMDGVDQIADDDSAAIARWWTDPDLNYERTIRWFENTYFGGEALPITTVNWGAMALAAMLGSVPVFNKETVWYQTAIDDWATWEWRFDAATNPTWQTILAIVERFLADAPGRYFIGTPELGNGADVLSLMRGMDRLALDLIEYPDDVARGVDFISDVWVQLMEQVYQMAHAINDGGDILAWMSLWAPGRIDQIACDFSSVISPAMFRQFFVPEIVKMGNWCEYGTYHLDGPACMKHMLDTVLTIPQIKTLQFTPGAGSPPTYTPAYLPRYKQVLASGRNLFLLATPREIELILEELPPEGLFFRTFVPTEDDANDLLKKVTQWSARKNQFVRPDLKTRADRL